MELKENIEIAYLSIDGSNQGIHSMELKEAFEVA